jgi:hypothetical protein
MLLLLTIGFQHNPLHTIVTNIFGALFLNDDQSLAHGAQQLAVVAGAAPQPAVPRAPPTVHADDLAVAGPAAVAAPPSPLEAKLATL